MANYASLDLSAEPFMEGLYPNFTEMPTSEYSCTVLQEEQIRMLNIFKLDHLRENYRYLKEHPEINEFINMLLTAICLERPECHQVRQFLCDYIKENFKKIQKLLETSIGSHDSSIIRWSIRRSLVEKLRQKHKFKLSIKSDSEERWYLTPSLIEALKRRTRYWHSTKEDEIDEFKFKEDKRSSHKMEAKPKRIIIGDFGFYSQQFFGKPSTSGEENIGTDSDTQQIKTINTGSPDKDNNKKRSTSLQLDMSLADLAV